MKIKKFWPTIILIIVILLGGFFRFYKLDWGEGHFFHPDEYHIAAAVNRLSFPSQMNPELFSYGSFTVYLIYFTKLILLTINPILIGRFYSALFSTLTILIVFLISQRLFRPKADSSLDRVSGWRYPLITAALCAAMPGLIQQAHFTTPESTLTFWLFLTLYLWIEWLEKKKTKFLYFSALSLGLALGTKIVALAFLPILVLLPLTTLQFKLLRKTLKTPSRWPKGLLEGGRKTVKLLVLPLFITGLVFFLVFPYALLDYQSFRSTTIYETGVGRGDPPVFYTRQFINTTPILFQYQKILPYTLGPAVLILGSLGFLLMLGTVILNLIQNLYRFRVPSRVRSSQTRQPSQTWLDGAGKPGMTKKKATNHKSRITNYSLLITAFLSYFLPNALLFAKWTRFLAPVFPFFAIFTVYLLSKTKSKILLVTCYLLLVTCLIWVLMFFSIYFRPDVRITATNWVNQNFPPDSVIFTEQGNMVEVPLEGNLKKTSLDFYGLEENFKIQQQIPELLVQADYFIVQSRRLFLNHRRLPGRFPKTAKFYDLLFSGQMGFEEIKEFSSYPKLEIARPRLRLGEAGGNWKLEIPDEVGEETWSVFDHPVIRIYKKVTPLSERAYENLLQI